MWGTFARRAGWAVLAVAGAGLAGCGSTSSATPGGGGASTAPPTITAAPTTATSTATTGTGSGTSSSATSTGGGPPAVALLHSVSSSSGVDLRVNGHSVAMLPAGSFVSDVAHGEAAAFETGGSGIAVVVVDLAGGTVHHVANDATGVTGAISPDGASVAYLASGSGGGFALRVATIATGAAHVLATYATGPVPDPMRWGADGIVAELIVPNSDAPPQGAARIDPSNGHELARSSGVGQNGMVACGDGDHVLTADHTSGLGDDGDAPPGPGPQGNPNTLRLVTVGGTQTILRKAAHHQIQPLACPSDGSIVVYMDGSAAGGFAGISQSPEFGLFAVQGGTATQLDHFGTTYESATILQDGSVAATRTDSSGSAIVTFGAGGPATSDNVPGATGSRVDFTTLGG